MSQHIGFKENDIVFLIDKNKKPTISMLGIDISAINPFFKNLIGFGFLFVVFGLLYLGLKKLTAPKELKKKEEKELNYLLKIIVKFFPF